MDLQYWIYVIIGIIYLVSRVMKKAENQPKDIPDQRPGRPVRHDRTPPVEKPKQLTFEELLKEITEAKQPRKPVYETVAPVEDVIDYDDQIEEEAQDLEKIEDYRKKDTIYKTYEDAKRQAFVRPSLEETLNVRDTNMSFGKFKEFEQEKKRNLLDEYITDFQDPEGLKKAVVMSEILKRKF